MISLQDLHINTIITADQAIRLRNRSESLDKKRLMNSVIISERRFLVEFMGTEFYEAFRNQKNVKITDDNKDAQQALLDAEIGADKYELQVGDVINDDSLLTDANKTFWLEHLWQIATECLFFVAFPDNYTDFTSAGIVHANPKLDAFAGGATKFTPDIATMKWNMDKMLTGRIDPLLKAAHQYLCDNKEDFPLYADKCKCSSGSSIDKPYTGDSTRIIDLYKDEKEW